MAMAMLDDGGAGPSGSSNPNTQGMGAGSGASNNVGGGYRYSAAYDDSSHPQHPQQQQQQQQQRQSFVGNTDNPRARYPSPSRPSNNGATRDSFRASSYSVGNLSNLSLSGQMPAPGGWDDLGAPTRPYDDVGVYGGAGGSGSNGRQSPYGGRASPAQYTGRQSPLFTPNLPPRLSQGNLRAQSDAYAFPVAGAVPNNPTSSSPQGQRRNVLERSNTEDTVGAGGRLSFPSTNDPSSRVVSSSDPDMMMDEQMRYSRSSAYLTHPPERPSSLSISSTPPPNAPRHPGVSTSGLPPSTPYASLVLSPLDNMNMNGIRTSIVSQPQTPIYNHTNNSGNVNINNGNGTVGPSNQRPMSGSTGYIAGTSPGQTQSQSQNNNAMGQNQTTGGTPSPTPQSQAPTGQGKQSPYPSHSQSQSPNNYPLSQSPQQQQQLQAQAQNQAQAQAQASRSISPARASGSGSAFRQPSPPSQVPGQGQSPSSIPALPSSLSARTPPPAAQPRDQSQTYAPYQPPLPTQAPSRPPVPPEEVCVECAMRDQDMADVDVLSPGVWERESDIAYADRLAHEDALQAAGLPPSEDPPPIVERGDRLTERHLKIWMSVNPKEPTSRQQTLNAYVKSQRALLEAEALAQAQAAAEERMREARVRDAQLRRSAYDAPMSAGVDEYGSVGQGYPQSSRHHHAQARSLSMPLSSTAVGGSSAGASIGGAGSRNTTLLENGMIVEQIDVKKEEREERERRKREERRERDASRARKSSRGSGGASVYSAPLPGSAGPVPRIPQDGQGLKPGQRTSQFSLSSRPASVLSSPLGGVGGERERPGLPRAYSQYSLAESAVTGPPQGVPQSGLVSPSPRRSRFFGFGRSRDSLAMSGMSGSMVDMHMGNDASRVATEATHGVGYYPQYAQQQPGGQARWSTMPQEQEQEYFAEEKAAKKKRGLLKLWKIVTGTNKPRQAQQQAQQAYQQGGPRSKSLERRGGYEGEGDGEGELAPPPPLSYLMARSGGAGEPPRQAGGHSPLAPGPPQSPQTAGAASSRRPDSILDGEMAQLAINAAFAQGGSYNNADADTISRGSIYAGSISHQGQVQRDKSLPPLPPEARLSPPLGGPGGARTPSDSGRGSSSTSTYFDMRPEAQAQTAQQAGGGGYLAAPPFRTVGPEGRRQSFNGVSNPRPESVAQTLPSSANYNRTGFMSPGAQQQGYQQGYNNQGFDQGTARARGNTIGQMPTRHQQQGYSQDPYAEFGRVQSRPASTLDYGSTTEGGGTLTGPKKRRSRFGLTSLFGKKGGSGGSGGGGGGSGPIAFPVQQDLGYQNHHVQGQEQGQAYGSTRGYPGSYQGEYAPYSQQAQAYPTSSSEDAYYGGAPPQAQGRPMSSYQQQQGGARMSTNGGGRMSVASRKAVEELVDQDREFVAYRYPSAMEREAYEREIRR